jgi:SAM-dependent methyltransferase
VSPEDHFGERIAARYDDAPDTSAASAAVEETVAFLADLAGDGAALELAIGTGRIALPLAALGVPVTGIDLSEAMVARLRAKPGGADMPVTIGDIAATRVPGSFRLVFLVFNTIMNLTSQDAQVACFQNAAAHLEPGGSFVIEVGIPDLQRLPFGERFRPFDVSADHLGFDEYEVATQYQASHHYTRAADGRFELDSIPFRYVWPAELDLMARLAGLSLRERWASWTRDPFTSMSESHVSVWQKT